MGGDNGRGVLLARKMPEQFENHVACRGVEIAGGFVCQKDAWQMDERARNSNALHLAAGELVWKAIADAFEFNPFKAFAGGFASSRFSSEEQREFDIFENRQRMQQLKRLKNETDALAPQLSETAIIQGRGRNSVQKDFARSRKIHGPGEIEQRRFSAATAPYQGHKFAALHAQRNAAQRVHWLAIR